MGGAGYRRDDMKRTKRYMVKTLSPDGLLKEPKNKYGDDDFFDCGYDSEDAAWEAIEEAFKFKNYGKSKYHSDASYIVICEWTVSRGD